MKELIIIVSNESSQLGRFAQTDPKEGNIQVPILDILFARQVNYYVSIIK